MSLLEQQASDLTLTAMGQKGSILVTDTTAITGKFRTIQVVTDAIFTTLTSDITKNGTVTASVAADFGTLSAGTVLYGKFTAITLTSGKVILYK
jgi:hypothetical protein